MENMNNCCAAAMREMNVAPEYHDYDAADVEEAYQRGYADGYHDAIAETSNDPMDGLR